MDSTQFAKVDNPWLFPAALFGHYRDCREKWRELLKCAWQANAWEVALTEERMIDVRSDMSDIVYEIDRGPIDVQMQTSQWWLSYAGDLRPSKTKSESVVLRDLTLVAKGLEFLWFVIASLGKRITIPFLDDPDLCFQKRKQVFEAIADRIIHWLPEILKLGPRLAEGAHLAEWQHARACPTWVLAIRQSLGMGGYHITNWPQGRDIWLELLDEHLGDPAKFLEIMRIIEPHEGRYRLGSSVVRNDC